MAVLRYLSVCSGIEAVSVAWRPLGFQPVAFSEIDPFASAVLAHHHPDVPNYGDLLRHEDWPRESLDILVGGTPCQSFSVAGHRRGLADPRGRLLFAFLGVAQAYRPCWVVWENVPGALSVDGGRAFGAFLGALGELGYGFAYRILDAQYFGLAQRRARVFVVGHLGDWRRATAVLFERESLSGHPAPRREARQDVAGSLTASTGGCDENDARDGRLISSTGEISHCLNAGGMGRIDYETETLIVSTLGAEMGRNRGLGNENEVGLIVAHSLRQVRRLTPRECERLQGFPDDYTLIPYRGESAADGPRYRALGNSMAVPILAGIGRRMQALDRLQRH